MQCWKADCVGEINDQANIWVVGSHSHSSQTLRNAQRHKNLILLMQLPETCCMQSLLRRKVTLLVDCLAVFVLTLIFFRVVEQHFRIVNGWLEDLKRSRTQISESLIRQHVNAIRQPIFFIKIKRLKNLFPSSRFLHPTKWTRAGRVATMVASPSGGGLSTTTITSSTSSETLGTWRGKLFAFFHFYAFWKWSRERLHYKRLVY